MKKQFFIAAVALTLATSFLGCSRNYWDEINSPIVEVPDTTPTTYMSVAFALPLPASLASSDTRAAADGQDLNSPNFNNKGKWPGQDKIKKITVYVFKGDRDYATLEAKQDFPEYELTPDVVNGKLMVKPSKGIHVTSGKKTIFVVLNPTPETDLLLPSNLKTTSLALFKGKYESAELTLTNSAEGSVADKLAQVEADKDVIVMTGNEETLYVRDDITEEEAIGGTENFKRMEFSRAVARVVVTTSQDSYTLAAMNPSTGKEAANFLTISDLHYVVGQGENKFYFAEKRSSDGTAAYTSPAFSQVPTNTGYGTPDYITEYQQIGQHYDYSGLLKNQANNTSTVKGFTVKQRTAFSTNPSTEYELVKADLQSDLRGQFVLPTLHKFSNSEALSGYRKGNTAYVMVRARITPQKYIDNNGKVSTASLSPNTDLYYGLTTGYFYVNPAHVTNPMTRGIAGQKAYKYTKGIALYFSWLNPDEVNTPINSPVVRNNLYHIHITGVEALGSNWNPLVPKGVNNPDPFPKDNPLEPETPRLAPHEPLNVYTPLPQPKGGALPQDNVWMTVKVNVVQWRIHSAPTELSGL